MISRRFQFSFTDVSLVYRSALAQIFPRSQPMRESNTSNNEKKIMKKKADLSYEIERKKTICVVKSP
jgi:hypothetical protein